MARYAAVLETLPPMTAEDLYDFRFLADAQISPDGARVAYVVRTIEREKNAYRSGIWLVPADGGAPGARFTSGPGEDALPRWSPDGRTLAFVSDRNAPADDAKKRKPKNIFTLTDNVGAETTLADVGQNIKSLK